MSPYPIPDALKEIALSDVYSAYRAEMPKPVSPDSEAAVRRDLFDLVNTSELINLTTLGPGGWPATHCMHFCVVDGEGGRPIIYMSTDHATRKLPNIRKEPRVSLSIYRALGFEERRKTRAAQMQAVCSQVEDPAEFAFALEVMHRKTGYEFTALLNLKGQAMLRADVVFSLWQDNQRRPQRCTVDYRSALACE